MRLLLSNLLVCLLAALTITPVGCRSTGSRWASLNPWKSGGQETSLAARSAPELPTAQSENPGGTAIAAAPAATGGEAPAFAAQQPPSSPYPTTQATGALPAEGPALAAAPPSSPYPTTQPATTPQAGPYDPNGYTPAATQMAAAPAASTPAADGDSRYAPSQGLPLADIPPVASEAPVGPPAGGRYAATPTTGLPGLTTTPVPPAGSPAMPGQPPVTPGGYGAVAQTSEEQVALPATPGGYRPGGTSSYDPQVSIALRTAPSAAPASRSAPPTTGGIAPAYPTTAPPVVPGLR